MRILPILFWTADLFTRVDTFRWNSKPLICETRESTHQKTILTFHRNYYINITIFPKKSFVQINAGWYKRERERLVSVPHKKITRLFCSKDSIDTCLNILSVKGFNLMRKNAEYSLPSRSSKVFCFTLLRSRGARANQWFGFGRPSFSLGYLDVSSKWI